MKKTLLLLTALLLVASVLAAVSTAVVDFREATITELSTEVDGTILITVEALGAIETFACTPAGDTLSARCADLEVGDIADFLGVPQPSDGDEVLLELVRLSFARLPAGDSGGGDPGDGDGR